MWKITLWILLSILIIRIIFYSIAKYISIKEDKNYKKDIKNNRKKELDDNWEYLEALEKWDKNAKLGKEHYFKEKSKRIKF